MADSPLIDIFDLCVERLASGETVEDCLRDYPEYANELRSLLETGFLVFQAQADSTDEQQAQAHTRSRIEQALQTDFAPHRGRNTMPTDSGTEKPKNRPVTIRRSVIWIGTSAAAVFIFTLGFAFATATAPQPQQQSQQVADAGMYMTNVHLRDVVATEAAREVVLDPNADPFVYTATAYVREITQTAIAEVLAMPVSYGDAIMMTETAIVAVNADDSDRDGLSDAREAELGTDPQKADTDNDKLSDGDEVLIWNTSPLLKDTDDDDLLESEEINKYGTDPLNIDTDGDGTNDGDEIYNGTDPLKAVDLFILTATKYVAEITETARADKTQTAAAQMALSGTPIAMLNPDATATPLPSATRHFDLPTLAPLGTMVPPANAAGRDTAITGEVSSTSVALYLPMTATALDLLYDEAGAKSSSDDGRTDPAEPIAPIVDGDPLSDEFKAVDGIESIVPYSGPAIVMEATIMPGTPSSVVLGGADTATGMLSPVLQTQLDPMKAGEIDDNAEWDTYTEFRRNYITSFGAYTILDFDISGRRIIKIVDAIGNPILGAHVEVYMGDASMDGTRVSDTYTYATGMTLFFPNALEETKRRDEFQVVVVYDLYEIRYTLDLRKVGDIVEIQFPVVVVRDPSAGIYSPGIVPTARSADNDLDYSKAASENATAAAENATLAAQNAEAANQNATAAYAAGETATYLAPYLVGTQPPPTFTPTPMGR